MEEKYMYLAVGAVGGILIGAIVTTIAKNREMNELVLELAAENKSEKSPESED